MPDPATTTDVGLVRAAFACFNARDAEGLAAMMDPAGQLFPYAIDERRHDGYTGHDGLREYLADIESTFERFDVRISAYRDVGDGVVLADGRIVGTTRTGGEVDMAAAWLWTCRDGKVVRMQAHPASGP